MWIIKATIIASLFLLFLGCPKKNNVSDNERYLTLKPESERYSQSFKLKSSSEPEYNSTKWHDQNWALIPQLITETGVDGWIENAIYIGNTRAAFTTIAGVTVPGKQALTEAERYMADHPKKDVSDFEVGGTFNTDQLLTAGLDLFFVKLASQQTIMRTTEIGSVVTDIRPTTNREGLLIYEVSKIKGASFGLEGSIDVKLLDNKGHEQVIPKPADWFIAGSFGLNKFLLINTPSLGLEDGRLLMKPIPDRVGAVWDVDMQKMLTETRVNEKVSSKDKSKNKEAAKNSKTLGKITLISAPPNVQVSPDFKAIAWVEQIDENGLKYFQIMVNELAKPIDYMLFQGRFPPKNNEWRPQIYWLDNRRLVTLSYRTSQETGTKATIALLVLNLEEPLNPKIIANDLIEGPKLIVSPNGKYVGYTSIEFSGYGPCFGFRVANTDQEAPAGQLLYMSHPSVKLFYPFDWRPDGQAIISEIRVPTPEAGKIKAQLIEFVLRYKPESRPKPMLAPPSSKKTQSTPEQKPKVKESTNPLQRPAEDMITE